MRRSFIKLSLLFIASIFWSSTTFANSVKKKIINKNLTEAQKNILFNEGTERPFTSSLLYEKT